MHLALVAGKTAPQFHNKTASFSDVHVHTRDQHYEVYSTVHGILYNPKKYWMFLHSQVQNHNIWYYVTLF